MIRKTIAEAQEFQAERFTKRVLFREEASSAFVLNFNPGQELPSHTHPGETVFVLVLEGTGKVIVDGKEETVTRHDCLLIQGTEAFSFKNTGEDPVSLYVVKCKA